MEARVVGPDRGAGEVDGVERRIDAGLGDAPAPEWASQIDQVAVLGNLITTQLPAAQFQANVAAGLYTGNVVCNAEPFVNYTAENPTAYSSGLYGGLTVIWVIQNGFIQIVFNGQITDIV